MGVTVLGRVHWKKLLSFCPWLVGRSSLDQFLYMLNFLMEKLDLHFSCVCWSILTVLLVDQTTCKCLRIELTLSLRRTGQQSMHHLKEAEIHKSELTGVFEILIKLGIQISKIVRCQFFGRVGSSRQPSTISRQLFFKTPLLPKLESFRKIHKVHFYLFLA